jgi:hypothetical protein
MIREKHASLSKQMIEDACVERMKRKYPENAYALE